MNSISTIKTGGHVGYTGTCVSMTFIYQNVSENLSGGQCACIAHVLHYIIYTNVFLPLLFYKMNTCMYIYLMLVLQIILRELDRYIIDKGQL